MTQINPQAATPTAFPTPGLFHVTQRVTLLCPTPGARIHYTTDGSSPTASSPIFDPYQLIPVEAVNEGDRGIKTSYAIRAMAARDGMPASEVADFHYTIDRRSKDEYVSDQIHPGVWRIRDFDDTNMFLVTGSQKALLIDAGLGGGDLKGYVESLAGSLPLEVVITHAHPDHIAQMRQFQRSHAVRMHHADLPLVAHFNEALHYAIDPSKVIDIREGYAFDLGSRRLDAYEVPGHTPGSIVLLDEANGLLFSGDAVGSNRPSIPDSLWMQHKNMAPIDVYLPALRAFRSKVRGKIKEIHTGHNDTPLYGEAYLDNMQQAAQNLVDQGVGILVPSLRPAGAWQVVVGDRMADSELGGHQRVEGGVLFTAAVDDGKFKRMSLPASGSLTKIASCKRAANVFTSLSIEHTMMPA